MPTNRKGSRRERECVNLLDEAGFAVLRAPASGGASPRALPDVLCGDGEHFYAMELKSSGGDPIYIDAEEIDALQYFADNFGATALIGARFDYEDWRFFRPDALYTTPSGNYRVKQDALSGGTPMAKLGGDPP